MENTNKKWEESEINFLKENYPSKGVKYCSDILQRNKEGVESKARRLNIQSTRTKFLYCEENILNVVANSKSLKECLETMGLKAAGGNYGVIKKYIEKYDISTLHFETIKEKNERIGFKPNIKDLKEILIENSLFSRTNLKQRLINEKILNYKCVECGNLGEWNGKPISLQLDHKNGVNNDNRIENLRFLCPNCHSQTETYSGKNKNRECTSSVKVASLGS